MHNAVNRHLELHSKSHQVRSCHLYRQSAPDRLKHDPRYRSPVRRYSVSAHLARLRTTGYRLIQ